MLIDVDGQLINTAQILRVEDLASPRGHGPRCVVHCVNGERLHLDASSSAFDLATGRMIPAPAGYLVVRAYLPGCTEADRRVCYTTEPVLAFQDLGLNGDLLGPITTYGRPRAPYAVVYPDGTCRGVDLEVEGDEYESVDAYKAAIQARFAARPNLTTI